MRSAEEWVDYLCDGYGVCDVKPGHVRSIMREAFRAGQEEMRNEAANACHCDVAELEPEGYCRAADCALCMMVDRIRALPIREFPDGS